jgi:hypothetical protein
MAVIEKTSPRAGPAETGGVVAARIDPAHTTENEAVAETSAALDLALASDAAFSADSDEQLRLHAAQLARQLDQRQDELDRRESVFNAQMAQSDAESRRFRLWLAEREEDLARRETELVEQMAKQQTRLDRIVAAETGVEKIEAVSTKTLAEREQQLAAMATRLERHTANAHVRRQRRRRRLESQRVATTAHDEQTALTLQQRERAIEQSEALLFNQQTQLARETDLLEAERRHVDELKRSLRADAAAAMEQANQELIDKRRALREQAAQIQRRETALSQLRAEVAAAQRENLEMRLATEELWIKLTDRVPSAELSRLLAELRARLAENYRLATQDVCEVREQLATLEVRLREEASSVRREREQFDAVAARRQADLVEQAERLSKREHEINQQEQRQRELVQTWKNEQRAYQQEISRLLSELRQQFSTAG